MRHWRYLVALALALHGLVHLIGVTVYWKLGEPEGFTYPETLLSGRIDPPAALIWVMGGGWLLATLGFLVAAAGLIRRAAWFRDLTLAVTALSLVLCVLAMPDAVAGVVIDLVVAAALLAPAVIARVPGGHHRAPRAA